MLARFVAVVASGLCLAVVAACGGKVVVDLPGAGSGGGGGGGAQSCDALLQSLQQKIAAAQVCSPFINSIQCDGSAMVPDSCGCSVLVNETNQAAIQAADAAAQAAAQGGCFAPCEGPCPFSGPGYCQPSSNGMTGVCAVAFE